MIKRLVSSRSVGRLPCFLAFVTAVLVSFWVHQGGAQNYFSVDFNSTGAPNSGVRNEASPEGEIFDGQGACCTNVRFLDEVAQLGLLDSGDEVNAYSLLHPAGFMPGGNAAPLDYSVGPGVANMRPDTLYRGGFGLVQVIVPGPALGLQNDDIDGYCYQTGVLPGHYFSLAPGSPSLATIPAKSSDILTVAAGPTAQVAVSFDRIGLAATDDIDALALWDNDNSGTLTGGDDVLLSLAPGSPSLGTIPAVAGDVLHTVVGSVANPGTVVVYTTRAFLGIPAGGNLDALDDTDSPVLQIVIQAQTGSNIQGTVGDPCKLQDYRLYEVDPGPDALYGTPDDIEVPLPGVVVNFSSLDPSVATVNPPSEVTGPLGEVSTLVCFVGKGETHVEAFVPSYGIMHYTQVTVTPPIPVLGSWGTVILVLLFFAVGVWWIWRRRRAWGQADV